MKCVEKDSTLEFWLDTAGTVEDLKYFFFLKLNFIF